jgi:hypothetical protein
MVWLVSNQFYTVIVSSTEEIRLMLSENVTRTVSVDITLNARNKNVANAVRGNCAINFVNALKSRRFHTV